MLTRHLRVAACVATACCVALVWSSDSRAADVEPFSLSAAGLLELARSPERRDEFSVAVQSEALRYELDDQHRLTATTHLIYRIDALDAVEEYGQIGASWEPYRQKRPEIRARVVTPDGREHQFDPATLSDETVATGDSRKFDDLHYLRGPLPAIAVGSVVEILTVVTDDEPKFHSGSSHAVSLASHGAVESTSVTVVTPSSSPFRYQVQLLPQAVVSQSEQDGLRTFTLRQGPIALEWKDVYVEAAGSVPLWPRFAFSTGNSWEEVAAAYRTLVEPAIRPDEVRALLPKDLPADPRQRLAKLLEILHERVRYTGVFFGQGDIVPNPPAVTLERRFGDCKDKSVVLASMLRAAGMEAEVVLLNSGYGADVDRDLPGIGSFNHMIVHVPGQNFWIDATAEYLGAGEVPYENSGRWALVVGPTEVSLVQTPDMKPAENWESELRSVTFADAGPGEIRVAARANGGVASAYRQLQDNDSKEMRENMLEQFRTNFSAKSVSDYKVQDDPTRGEVTFNIELRQVEAAMTSLQEAGVSMSLGDLFANVPYGLLLKPAADADKVEEEEEETNSASRAETRTLDWVFQPFVAELNVKVVPPKGFKLRSLPKSADQQLGPLRLSQAYQQDADGSVTGTIRTDSVRGRYSADEGRAFREAYLGAESSLILAVRFDHESWLLARNGKPAAALRRHEELIAAEPGKAMPRVRAASQLLEFGLMDEAKAQAERATQQEPKSAWAYNMLGSVLQSDGLGRRFGGPYDRVAAIRALREAVKLDPDNLDFKLNLAAVAEYNAEGVRYGKGSDLDLAVENYRAIVAKKPEWQYGSEYLIQALWQQRKYDEVVSVADKAEGSAFAAGARLAARVKTIGPEAALDEDASRTDAAGHRTRMGTAMAMLWGIRSYDEARALLEATGVENLPQQSSMYIDLLRNIARSDDLPEPAATAAGTTETLVRLMFSDTLDEKHLRPWLSKLAQSEEDVEAFVDEFEDSNRSVSRGVARIGADVAFVRDLVLSNISVQEAPFTENAKRVTVSLGGTKLGSFCFVQEGSAWRLLGMSEFDDPVMREPQRLLEAGDTAGARAWLAAVKSELEAVPNAETGQYRHFLNALPTTSALNDEAAIRLAALALLVVRSAEYADVEDLDRAAAGLTTATQQEILEEARFDIAWARKDGPLAIQAAENLEQLKPGTAESLRMRAFAYETAQRWEDAEQASRIWIEQRPGDGAAKRALVRALNGQGRYTDALAVLAPEVQEGRADASQLNNYAWQALRAGAVDSMVVKAAENSHTQLQRRDYATAHTLACVYADQGRVAESRRVLLQLLEERPNIDPESGEIWLVRGLIAEALGEASAATKSYRQIEKPERDDADSPYAIAATRLARFEGPLTEGLTQLQ